jgi:hypothetical protein
MIREGKRKKEKETQLPSILFPEVSSNRKN